MHKFYINFNPKNRSNRLQTLPVEDLDRLFHLTQYQKSNDGNQIEPILYFAGTPAQKPIKHFKLFNGYYSKAVPRTDQDTISDEELLQRFTLQFDSGTEDTPNIWKWNEWKLKNTNYDPSKFKIDVTEVNDVDVELLKDIPKLDVPGAGVHAINVNSSLTKLTQSLSQSEDIDH